MTDSVQKVSLDKVEDQNKHIPAAEEDIQTTLTSEYEFDLAELKNMQAELQKAKEERAEIRQLLLLNNKTLENLLVKPKLRIVNTAQQKPQLTEKEDFLRRVDEFFGINKNKN